MVSKRYYEIDLLKGIGIILMIMGHVPFSEEITKAIYVFHMPLFFIASGFLYKRKNDFNTAFVKWLKRLILPYFIFATLGYVLWNIEIRPNNFSQLTQPLESIFYINTDGMPINGAVWYLTATFVIFLLYWIVDNFFKNEFLKMITVIILTTIGLFLGKLKIVLPFSGAVSLVGIGFFYSGITLRKFYPRFISCLRERRLSRYTTLILVVCMFFLGYRNGHISMRTGDYGKNGFIFFIAAMIISYILLFVSKFLVDIFQNNILLKWIEKVGRNSIVFLGLNELVINVIRSVLTKLNVSANFYVILTFILSILVISILIEIMKKSNMMVKIFALS